MPGDTVLKQGSEYSPTYSEKILPHCHFVVDKLETLTRCFFSDTVCFILSPASHKMVYIPFLSFITDATIYESWNFNSGNYLFTTDTKIDICFGVLLSFGVVTSIVYNPLPAMWKS